MCSSAYWVTWPVASLNKVILVFLAAAVFSIALVLLPLLPYAYIEAQLQYAFSKLRMFISNSAMLLPWCVIII